MTTSNINLEDLTFNSKEEIDNWCENTFIGVGKIIGLDYKNKVLERSYQVSHIPSLAIFEDLYIAAKSAYKQHGINADPKKYTLRDLGERVFSPIDAIEKSERELRENPPIETPDMISRIRDYTGSFLKSLNPAPSFYNR